MGNGKIAKWFVTASLLATIVVPAGAAGAATATKQATGIIQSSVSFRDKPSTSSNVMRYLKAGESVAIQETVNAYWFKVRDSAGNTGYVSSGSKFISVSAAEVVPDAAKPGNGTAVAVASVSFRKGASTSAGRIRYLAKNETVTIVSQPNSYWYQVRDAKGTVGYVSSSAKYIRVTGGTNTPSTPAPKPGNTVNAIIEAGKEYLGTPYQYGSDRNSTAFFDCSAFVRRAFLDGAGIKLPADSRQQGSYVKNKGNTTTSISQLKAGDLMFFMSYKGTSKSAYNGYDKSKQTITHVGIYLGDGKVLHTYSKESGGVRIDTINGKHWEYRFMFGGSAL